MYVMGIYLNYYYTQWVVLHIWIFLIELTTVQTDYVSFVGQTLCFDQVIQNGDRKTSEVNSNLIQSNFT
jgi:hypothetical protein